MEEEEEELFVETFLFQWNYFWKRADVNINKQDSLKLNNLFFIKCWFELVQFDWLIISHLIFALYNWAWNQY